jgi:digeranylgeranylglycerophospholipid reductase
MKENKYDVIIAGGSFAGLVVAKYITTGRKLIFEQQNEIGARQRSTCGAPVHWIKKLGANKSILKTFDKIILHSTKDRVVVELEKPYCTIDYKKFCQSVSSRLKNTEIKTGEKVIGVKNNKLVAISTKKGLSTGKIAVDCTGWRAILASTMEKGFSEMSARIAGIETEVNYEDTNSIHMYFGSRYIPGGYAWIFPISEDTARIGLGSMRPLNLLRFHRRFLNHLGIEAGNYDFHGGIIPCAGLRRPVVGGVFVVGDAAGQVLPLSAEGIRKTFDYARICGELITKVLKNELRLSQALERYEQAVYKDKKFYDNMLFIQRLVYRAPDWVFDNAIKRLGKNRELTHKLLRLYMNSSLTHPKTVLVAGLIRLSLGL